LNSWLRQIHRWLSIAFTVAVVVAIAEQPTISEQTFAG
jgi:hypothetical protein